MFVEEARAIGRGWGRRINTGVMGTCNGRGFGAGRWMLGLWAHVEGCWGARSRGDGHSTGRGWGWTLGRWHPHGQGMLGEPVLRVMVPVVQNLLRVGSALLDSSTKRHWELIQQTEGGTAWLLKHFEDYASALAQNMPQTYLSPFTIVTPNIGQCRAGGYWWGHGHGGAQGTWMCAGICVLGRGMRVGDVSSGDGYAWECVCSGGMGSVGVGGPWVPGP